MTSWIRHSYSFRLVEDVRVTHLRCRAAKSGSCAYAILRLR